MSESSTSGSLVYVVDDDAAIARLVSVNLAARGYRVKHFSEGQSVQECLGVDSPDLMILDIVMPGINGLEVASRVRQVSTIPIMMLSVRDKTSAMLAALDLGADDYVTKPFRIEELLARVRAMLRRSDQAKAGGGSGPALSSATAT
jgi:DNA-binding response OmpR family regulator